MAETLGPSFSPSSTIGALEIGMDISMFLFGVVTVQVNSYYRKFSNDPWYLKAFVMVIWVFELFHAITMSHAFYYASVIKYGKPDGFMELPLTMRLVIIASAIIGPAVQAFFANRIRIMSSKWITNRIGWLLSILGWMLSLLRCISLIAAATVQWGPNNVLLLRSKWKWLVVTSLSISAANDVFIATSLCHYLWRWRDIRMAWSKSVIDNLILWTIWTGLLTSLATTTELILFIARDDYSWVAIHLIISRLFSNSLMSSLHARDEFRATSQKFNGVNELQYVSQRTTNTNIAFNTDQSSPGAKPEKSLRGMTKKL